ncbi:MAG: hypothetical protein V4557_12365 [Bacteroidota bacterium]
MAQTHIVFNDQIEEHTGKYISRTLVIPQDGISAQEHERRTLALLFEQFLLFDKISLKIDRESHVLYYLIKALGLNRVEELIDHGVIIPVLWTPIIVTSTGMQREDGSIDHDAVFGKPPLIVGRLSENDSNPEFQVDRLLNHFSIDKDRKRIFKKRVVNKFVLPDNEFATDAAEIVMDAYEYNNLASLGLAANKEPEQLDYLERGRLLELGHQVLQTSIIADQGYKSYDNFESFTLTNGAVRNIESAYEVSENTSEIFKIEGLADIKQLVLDNRIPFDRVFDLRYNKNIKEYRKWINSLGKNEDATPITKEYIDEVMGKNNFFESTGGKFVRTIGMMGIGAGVGTAVAGPVGGALGAGVGKVLEVGLSLLDTYVLDGILKGWNPRMFVDAMRIESEGGQYHDKKYK